MFMLICFMHIKNSLLEKGSRVLVFTKNDGDILYLLHIQHVSFLCSILIYFASTGQPVISTSLKRKILFVSEGNLGSAMSIFGM